MNGFQTGRCFVLTLPADLAEAIFGSSWQRHTRPMSIRGDAGHIQATYYLGRIGISGPQSASRSKTRRIVPARSRSRAGIASKIQVNNRLRLVRCNLFGARIFRDHAHLELDRHRRTVIYCSPVQSFSSTKPTPFRPSRATYLPPFGQT